MKPVTRIYLYDEENERFFGEGPCCLLHGIEDHGSLRSAAIHMNMAYSKAFSMIRHAEKALGFPLTEKQIGGKNGGGSRLTPQAKEFLQKYEQYKEACCEANRRIYSEIFSDQS